MENLLEGVDDWDWDEDLNEAEGVEPSPAPVGRRVLPPFERVH